MNDFDKNKKKFIRLCKLSQVKLKKYCKQELEALGYENIIYQSGFLAAKGDIPVLLIAHMDTVHKKLPKQIIQKNDSLSSLQGIGGDDRCGIFMILELIQSLRCSVLFTEDEEIGCIGAKLFAKSPYISMFNDCNYIIELDRNGSNDAVYYDCDNEEFEEFISREGYKTEWGSCSDISAIAPELGIAAVNLSCGYYFEHTLQETVKFNEIIRNISRVKNIISKEQFQFEYVERELPRWNRTDYEYLFNLFNVYLQDFDTNRFVTLEITATNRMRAIELVFDKFPNCEIYAIEPCTD